MNKIIGAFILSLRKEAKMTQEQLAESLGVSNRSVSRWENGYTLPDLQLMKEICELFHISISELINGERQMNYLWEGNGKKEEGLRAHQAMEVMIKLFDYEKKRKTKYVAFYFWLGTIFWGIILLQLLFFTFGFRKARRPQSARRLRGRASGGHRQERGRADRRHQQAGPNPGRVPRPARKGLRTPQNV